MKSHYSPKPQPEPSKQSPKEAAFFAKVREFILLPEDPKITLYEILEESQDHVEIVLGQLGEIKEVFSETYPKSYAKILNNMEMLSVQLENVAEVVEAIDSLRSKAKLEQKLVNVQEKYEKRYSHPRYAINVVKPSQFNFFYHKPIFENLLNSLITPLAALFKKWTKKIKDIGHKTTEDDLKNLRMLLGTYQFHLESISAYMNYVFITDPNSILLQPLTSPKWAKLRSHLKFVEIDSKSVVYDNYETVRFRTNLFYSALHTAKENGDKEIGWGTAWHTLKNMFHPERSMIQANFFKNQRPEKVLQMWVKFWQWTYAPGPTDFISNIVGRTLKMNKRMAIPRRALPPITEAILLEQIRSGEINKIADVNEDSYEKYFKEVHDQSNLMDVKVRVVYDRDTLEERQDVTKGVVIYIHGGGFVCCSSATHLGFCAQVVKSLDMPIVSVDYGKAPDCPFPEGLNDCWQVYYWMVVHGEEHGFNTDKIILAGDSAGGNLAIGVTIWAIKNNFRIPDGLCLCYGAMNIHTHFFFPSYLYTLSSSILSFGQLRLFIKCYCQNEELYSPKNIFQSPYFTSKEILEKFPATKLLLGHEDVLLSENMDFLRKLVDLKVDADMIVYQWYQHGIRHPEFIEDAVRVIWEMVEKETDYNI